MFRRSVNAQVNDLLYLALPAKANPGNVRPLWSAATYDARWGNAEEKEAFKRLHAAHPWFARVHVQHAAPVAVVLQHGCYEQKSVKLVSAQRAALFRKFATCILWRRLDGKKKLPWQDSVTAQTVHGSRGAFAAVLASVGARRVQEWTALPQMLAGSGHSKPGRTRGGLLGTVQFKSSG